MENIKNNLGLKLELLKYQNLLLEDLVETKRYLYSEVSNEARMIGIIGLRGVGKTTLLLQKLKEGKNESIYFSLDNPKISNIGLFNVVETLYFDYGIRSFYIDEIHKYKNWNQELKNIYDSFPKAKIMFSGSSSVDILKGSYDLSRRVLIYKLNILSFREYLEIKHKINIKKINLEDIFSKNINLENLFIKLFNISILEEFRNYLNFGEFPFFQEGGKKDYILRLENIINKIIYEDISNFYNLKTENLIYFKEILYFIINSEPGLFSANSLSKSLKISNDSVNNYINILNEIGLINLISSYGNITQTIRKAKKIYLSINNTDSLSSFELINNSNIGRLRESFIIANFTNINKKLIIPKIEILYFQ
ncbi:MAG: AAA family ATPase [Candidatus Gracilibacteria bacterium]|nr:AAA family ATPase [Candidatus Gracilibacteria bacterium]